MKLWNIFVWLLVFGAVVFAKNVAPLKVIAVDQGAAGYSSSSVSGVAVYLMDASTGELLDKAITASDGVTFNVEWDNKFYVTTSGDGAATGGPYGFYQELSGQGVPVFTISRPTFDGGSATYTLCRTSNNECSYSETPLLILYRLKETAGESAAQSTPAPVCGGSILYEGESKELYGKYRLKLREVTDAGYVNTLMIYRMVDGTYLGGIGGYASTTTPQVYTTNDGLAFKTYFCQVHYDSQPEKRWIELLVDVPASASPTPTPQAVPTATPAPQAAPTPVPTSGYTVSFQVGVNNYPDSKDYANTKNIDGWVSMYKVAPVSQGVYKGTLIQTERAYANSGAKFVVAEGGIVDFVGFRSYEKATAASAWTFSVPPYKNFGKGSGGLCQINYLDESAPMMLSDGRKSCALSLSVPYQDAGATVPTPVPPSTPGPISNRLNVYVWEDRFTPVANAEIAMYRYSDSQLLETGITNEKGYDVFKLSEEGTKVYFVAKSNGKKYTHYPSWFAYDSSARYICGLSGGEYKCPPFTGAALYPGVVEPVPTKEPVVPPSALPVPEQLGYSVKLQPGWNLFSVPWSHGKLMSSTCDRDTVFSYNAESRRYTREYLSAKNSFGFAGYWMKAAQECELKFSVGGDGFYYSKEIAEQAQRLAPHWKLRQGWNTIGASYDAVPFSEIAGTCEPKSGPWWYNPQAKSWEKAGALEQGKGYFVKVAEDCTLGAEESLPPLPPN